jgi:hypothetical protein
MDDGLLSPNIEEVPILDEDDEEYLDEELVDILSAIIPDLEDLE